MQTILSSSVTTTPRGPVARVVIDTGKPGVLPVLYFFPLDILEWRAAEYDIDQDDVDTLLDIVLNEPFLEEATDPYAAATGAEGREAHRARIAELKSAGRGLQRAAGKREADPLQPVKDAHTAFVDADEVAAKTKYVAQHRAARQAQERRMPAGGRRRPLGGTYDWPEPKEASRA